MKEPARRSVEETAAASDEPFPASTLLLAYVLFFENMLFFLMPPKFQYLLATMDAAWIPGGSAALASGIFMGISGCAPPFIGLFYGRVVYRFHRYTVLALTFVFFGVGYCSLGCAASPAAIGLSVIFIGVGEGLLMPTVLSWIAAVTPRPFLGQFASTLLSRLETSI
jgi:MFS family permease